MQSKDPIEISVTGYAQSARGKKDGLVVFGTCDGSKTQSKDLI